jgi:hypothetical protein
VQLTCFGRFSSKEKNVNVGILITMAGVILKSLSCSSYVTSRMRCLLKVDQSSIMINHKFNNDFKRYIILRVTQNGYKRYF